MNGPEKAGADGAESAIRALLELGRRFEGQGNPAEALEAYRHAQRLAPKGSALSEELALVVAAISSHREGVAAPERQRASVPAAGVSPAPRPSSSARRVAIMLGAGMLLILLGGASAMRMYLSAVEDRSAARVATITAGAVVTAVVAEATQLAARRATAAAQVTVTAMPQATIEAQSGADPVATQAAAGRAMATATAAAQAASVAAAQATTSAQAQLTAEAAARARQTAEAQAAATRQAQPTVDPVVARVEQLISASSRVLGPIDGLVTHDSNRAATVLRGIKRSDFVVEARFFNPWPATLKPFDYGFILRQQILGDDGYVVYISSDGTWRYALWKYGVYGSYPGGGGRVEGLDVSATGSNELRVLAEGGSGRLFVNKRLVGNLDLTKSLSGDLGMLAGYQHAAAGTTRFDSYSIYTIP